MSKIEIIVFIN